MRNKYTDLAAEAHEINAQQGKRDGIIIDNTTIDGIPVTEARVPDGEERKKGSYYTVDVGNIRKLDGSRRKTCSSVIASLLKKLSPRDGCVLIVGLGNRNVTSDSVGPQVADGVIVTRHLKILGSPLFSEIGFGEVASVVPGVLGQTGIESFDLVKSAISIIKPSLLIAVDALASRSLSRLCTTVQITDTGISPGSGVENKRAELSAETLGLPVIAIGLPTVVDAATLAYDLLDELAKNQHIEDDNACDELANELLSGSGGGVYVCPKESDVVIREAARIIADGINMAYHPRIPYSELDEYRTG